MMHLEFPPQFVHVAFTLPTNQSHSLTFSGSNENQDPNNENALVKTSKFAVMGEYGNNVNIYESNSFFIKHQINVGNILKQF